MTADQPGRCRPTASTLALTVVLVVGAAGCADEPVAPLPVRPPATSSAPPPVPSTRATTEASGTQTDPPSVTATTRPAPVPRTPATRRSTPAPSPTPTASEVCLGAVRYELSLSDPGPLPSSLCFATGGVLRLRDIGPGEVTVDREDLVDSQYEAGVVDLRFVRSGTVEVFIPRADGTHVITVVVR